MIVAAIKPELVPLIWHKAEPMISRAVEHSNGEICINNVFKRLTSGEMVLLTVNDDAEIAVALVIEKREFPTGKTTLNVTLAGGDKLDEWMSVVDDTLVKLAKDYNCSDVYIVGRAGWVRALKKLGYGSTHTIVSKKVGD